MPEHTPADPRCIHAPAGTPVTRGTPVCEICRPSLRVITEGEMDTLTLEAERGYCTEWLGGTQAATAYCLKPAIALVAGPGGGLKCEQHVKGFPDSVVRQL